MEIEIDPKKYSHLDPAGFHLRDKVCVSNVSGNTIKLRTSLNGCGTTIEETTGEITYKNEVRAYNISNTRPNATVTREGDLTLKFNCTYQRKRYISVPSFQPRRKVTAAEGSFGNFTFEMDLFSDKSYTTRYMPSNYPISVQLNDPIYVQYQVLSVKGDLYVFAEKCLATTTPSRTSLPNYVFLDKGCKVDDTMVYNYSVNIKQKFSIKAFRFIADHPVVYLHCLLMVCHSGSQDSSCVIGCSDARSRRGITRGKADESSLYHLASGPLVLKKVTQDVKPSDGTSGQAGLSVIVLSSAVGILLFGCIVLLVLLCRRKQQKRKTQSHQPGVLQAYDHPGFTVEEDTWM